MQTATNKQQKPANNRYSFLKVSNLTAFNNPPESFIEGEDCFYILIDQKPRYSLIPGEYYLVQTGEVPRYGFKEGTEIILRAVHGTGRSSVY